jgi:hypothetical protein
MKLHFHHQCRNLGSHGHKIKGGLKAKVVAVEMTIAVVAVVAIEIGLAAVVAAADKIAKAQIRTIENPVAAILAAAKNLIRDF